MTVSTIIPVYNSRDLIGDTLETVLGQSRKSDEIVVVDDGSTDGTDEIVLGFPSVTLLRQANQGEAVARNLGIQASTGEALAFLDHDDHWLPGKLETQMRALEADPELMVVFSHIVNVVPKGEAPSWAQPGTIGVPLPGYLPSAMLVRRLVFAWTGLFVVDNTHTSDVDFCFRVRDLDLASLMLEEVLVHRNLHASNASGRVSEIQQGLLNSVRRSLLRRRGLLPDEFRVTS